MQTYEDAVIKTVLWWSEKSFQTTLNQNNGDDSPTGGLTFALMNTLAMDIQNDTTKAQIKKFEEKLTELLMGVEHEAPYLKSLEVDYDPCRLLGEAMEHATINLKCLPIKSHTRIDKNNVVWAKYQYGNGETEL